MTVRTVPSVMNFCTHQKIRNSTRKTTRIAMMGSMIETGKKLEAPAGFTQARGSFGWLNLRLGRRNRRRGLGIQSFELRRKGVAARFKLVERRLVLGGDRARGSLQLFDQVIERFDVALQA